jgi:putative ABC transport system substrate-binding protein
MDETLRIRVLESDSGNRKSKIQNRKWAGIFAIAVTFAFSGAVAQAQQPGKIHRIGFLSGGVPGSSRGIPAIQQELRALGYVEGKNISFEYRYAEDKPARSPALADELVRLKVDVIVAGGDSDTRAAKSATRTIPIVFLESTSDPVALGLVASLARPEGNITGFTTIADVLAGKRLELLKETIPKLSRVAVLRNPQSSGQRATMERKPTRSTTTGSATSFHGGKQRRPVRERV